MGITKIRGILISYYTILFNLTIPIAGFYGKSTMLNPSINIHSYNTVIAFLLHDLKRLAYSRFENCTLSIRTKYGVNCLVKPIYMRS